MTHTSNLPPYPDHTTFRMIGAVFWLGLLVIIIPQWFVNPVEFSPDGAANHKTETSITPSETAVQSLVTNASLENESTQTAKSELYIETPLTIKPPKPDPNKVNALHQSIQMREAQADSSGKLVVNNDSAQISAALPIPPVVPDGHYFVQVASYTVEANALKYRDKFKSGGFPGKINVYVNKDGKAHYQIRVGPYQDADAAQLAKKIVDEKFKTNAMVLFR